ncbi:outer membrane protein assembly factor BamD [Candidatus Cloacimonadota bacterium]
MKKIIYLVIVVFLFGACSSTKISKSMSVEEKMAKADEFYNLEKYRKAIPYYTEVVLDRNSIYTAEAQMKLGNCYYYQDKFMEARFEYQELIRLFKKYSNLGEAYYRIGVCYFKESLKPHYTQEETRKAILAFETYLDKFPFHDKKEEAQDYLAKCNYKLLEKTYYNGYAYYKLSDYSSALLYLEEVTSLNITDELDKKALYYSGKIFCYRKDKGNTLLVLDKMKQRYPDADETKTIEKLLAKIK